MQNSQEVKQVSGFRHLGGTGSKVKFTVEMFDKGVPKVEKIGRIADMTDPLQIVELDKDGKEGKTWTVPCKDVTAFLDSPKA